MSEVNNPELGTRNFPYTMGLSPVTRREAEQMRYFDEDFLTFFKELARNNRNIRFSTDKSPYKLHVAAAISRGGRRNTMSEPGNYFHFSADSATVCGGLFRPDKETLLKVRRQLVKHPGRLSSILSSRGFRSKWREIRGDRNKVLPKEFKGAGEKNPLLYNKAFYVLAELPPETALRPDLAALLMRYFRSVRPLNDFLRQALE